jgi:hypothetical protein
MGSLFLCAPPSALSGAGRLLDFGNTFDAYNRAETGAQADAIGILWDWAMVGGSLWQALSEYEASTKPSEVGTESEVEMASR